MLTLIGEYKEQGSLLLFETKLADSFVGLLQGRLFKEGFILTKIGDLPNWTFRIVTDKKTVVMRGSFCVNDVIKKLWK